ncbi:hypothetical protein TRFO_30903 [Tritrichomonas foetus]|uniref:Uncharacterized protein n=1 Tax=Tritrichomonas foetus TaxID=1144522 RepID=A0A1J4JX80_9EUKA|nr:hypothetical protein TRFO_30903 [Tritrichomonas foetus]|eukprot:OHT02140.1 hypothetical protein TRFO_30903 [Tritrichomonas foetus]
MEWTPEQQSEIDLIIDMQSALTEINSENLDHFSAYFLDSKYVLSEKKFTELVRNIMSWSTYHPQKIYAYSDLLKYLYDNNQFIKKIASRVIITTMNHIIFANRCAKIEPPPLHVLVQCYIRDIVTSEEIVSNLEKCLVEKRNIKENLSAYFMFFAPEVEKINPELYEKFIRYIKINDYSQANHRICAYFNFFKKNNWEKLKSYRSNIHCCDPILKMLLDDDVEQLRKMNAHPEFNVDLRLKDLPPLSPFYFINDSPPLVCAAAALNAVKCFKYLVQMNASLSNVSESRLGIAGYAAMSGNLEIIRIVEQNGENFEGTLHMAVTFHNDDIFYWLHESKFPDLLISAPKKKSILGQAASSNNVSIFIYCIEKGLDVNRIDENDECMLERAAYFGCNEIIKIALWLPNLIVNQHTRSPPLCAAAFNGNNEIIQMLLEHPNIDINILNHRKQPAICLAASSSHCSSFVTLLNAIIENNTNNSISADNTNNTDNINDLNNANAENGENDENDKNNSKMTEMDKLGEQILHSIGMQNNPFILKEFLKKFPNVNINEFLLYRRSTVMHMVCKDGNIDLLKEMLTIKNIDLNIPESNGTLPLDLALQNFQVDIVQLLLSSTNARPSKIRSIREKIYSLHNLDEISIELLETINFYIKEENSRSGSDQNDLEIDFIKNKTENDNEQQRIVDHIDENAHQNEQNQNGNHD